MTKLVWLILAFLLTACVPAQPVDFGMLYQNALYQNALESRSIYSTDGQLIGYVEP